MRKLCLLAAAAAAFACSSQALTLVNDTFTDTDRINGVNGASTTTSSPVVATPTSTNTQWVSNSTSNAVASSSGMLWTLNATSNRFLTGYFPDVVLAENTTTTISLWFTTGTMNPVGTTNNLRIAIVDGAPSGIRQTDGTSTDNAYVNDAGYAFFSTTNIGGSAPAANLGMNILERTTLTNTSLLGTGGDWTAFGASYTGTGNFGGNTGYLMEFTFTLQGGQLEIGLDISGGDFANMSFSRTDTASPITTLNQIQIRFGGGSNQFNNINFTEFKVEQVAVPEPSSFAALIGLAALGFGLSRRRRSA